MDLQSTLPWTRRPLVINAPMGGIAGADLAIPVSKAGGLGMIGAKDDMKAMEADLQKVEATLGRENGLLPVGLGLLTFVVEPEAALAVLERFPPTVVWLFAAKETADYATWAREIRTRLPKSQLWIQVGSVKDALVIAQDARPNVICVQGIDAGGHGFEKGAGVISLLPEVSDALMTEGFNDIALVAAGGIADGRSAAAALTLGAQGTVLGTRFLSAPETNAHPGYRAAVVHASDGGQSTVRAKVFDELRGPNAWPVPYDGRSLRMQSFADFEQGTHIDEIRRRHAEAVKGDDAGYAIDGQGRAVTWCGTGVGLVKREQPAAEIVEEVRNGIRHALKAVQGRL